MHTDMIASRCSQCVFPGVEDTLPPESFQFVLCHGSATLRETWRREAEACRNMKSLPGVSAYCETCRAITWLTDNEDPQEALILMLRHKHRLRELMQVFSPASLSENLCNSRRDVSCLY